jgi:hypothetical protein
LTLFCPWVSGKFGLLALLSSVSSISPLWGFHPFFEVFVEFRLWAHTNAKVMYF